MKINQTVQLTVISKKEEPSKDGTKMYKRLGVLTLDGEVGMLPCSDEVYEQVVVGKQCILETQYNDQYSSFRVISASVVK